MARPAMAVAAASLDRTAHGRGDKTSRATKATRRRGACAHARRGASGTTPRAAVRRGSQSHPHRCTAPFRHPAPTTTTVVVPRRHGSHFRAMLRPMGSPCELPAPPSSATPQTQLVAPNARRPGPSPLTPPPPPPPAPPTPRPRLFHPLAPRTCSPRTPNGVRPCVGSTRHAARCFHRAAAAAAAACAGAPAPSTHGRAGVADAAAAAAAGSRGGKAAAGGSL